MQTKPRTARPGDVCVLLEPAGDEIAKLHQLQMSLQCLFGGRPHERVHLTCQRFELREERLLPELVHRLRTNLVAIQPFPITASSLAPSEHRFWQSRLLRWHIQVTTDVRRFARRVEDGLVATGVTPHFPQASGWVPTRVTALEAIPRGDLDSRLSDLVFPQHLFTGRQVVVSKIIGQRQFEILETIRLSDNHYV
jgi:hypothetical protein